MNSSMDPPVSQTIEKANRQPLRLNYLRYILETPHQAYPSLLRVLEPDRLDRLEAPKLVYILPVVPDVSMRWNDGLDTFLALDLHNRYGLIAVAPSFSHWPWYADHPSDTHIQQETFMVEEVVPFVRRLYPAACAHTLLLGFSKSGHGAFQLLLRHPALFHAAAAWDAPLMLDSIEHFEMGEIYGTQDNFEQYRIAQLIRSNVDWLHAAPRLALFGHSLFGGDAPFLSEGQHLEAAHALLEELHIPHVYALGVRRAHRWDSGWMEQAVAALVDL